MSDADNIEMPEAQESLEAAAFKKAGYNRTVFKIKSFITETVGGAMKGAMIGAAILAGGLVLGTALGLAAIPVVGSALAAGGVYALFATSAGQSLLLGAAMLGGGYGGGIGGLIKGGIGLSNLDEMADDEENRLVMKYQQAQQREINQKQMLLNQEIMKRNAAGGQVAGMGMAPQMTPQGAIAQNQGFGPGMGGKV